MGKPRSGLPPKQELFCKEYLVDLNGTQAAIRAGYSPKCACEQASELLRKPQIYARVQELMNKRSSKMEINSDTVLQEILRLARVDLSEAYDKDGKLLHPKDMPEDVRRAISAIEVFEEHDGVGKDRKYIGETMKVKFWDKTKALELLGKHLKLFTDKIEHSHRVTLEDLVTGSHKGDEV